MVKEGDLSHAIPGSVECLHYPRQMTMSNWDTDSFVKKLVCELVFSVQIENVLGMNSPTGRPRSAQDPALRLVSHHFPQMIAGTGKKRTITRVCIPAER